MTGPNTGGNAGTGGTPARGVSAPIVNAPGVATGRELGTPSVGTAGVTPTPGVAGPGPDTRGTEAAGAEGDPVDAARRAPTVVSGAVRRAADPLPDDHPQVIGAKAPPPQGDALRRRDEEQK